MFTSVFNFPHYFILITSFPRHFMVLEKSGSARTLELQSHQQHQYTVDDGNEKSVSFSTSGLEMSPGDDRI